MTEVDPLLAAISALEAQRGVLGDAAVDASVAALRARLAALAPAAEQSLRQVTVLFLDIVGSTTLGQRLDPEEIHAVLDGALARCTAIVEAHRGKVLQYAGDNLLAVFGAEQASEDDAERAVHCGLALLREGERLGGEVRARHGHAGFGLRLGAHTGGVLLGGGVDAEGSIRGIAVHIAARMEQTAPAGALRISHDTWRLVAGRFDCDAQAPIAVKGIDAPIASYLVRGPAARRFGSAGRGVDGADARMIGRDAELDTLRQALERLFARRELIEIAIVGEAGIGKSRLLREFERRARERQPAPAFLRGRCTPQTPHQPFGLLRDIVARWLRIADGDSAAAARGKIEAGIAPLFDADTDAGGNTLGQAHAHLLGHLIGIDFSESPYLAGIRDDARQIHLRAFHAASELLRRAALEAPVVLLLEDLHWADDGTLDFLARLVQADRDVPILLLALTRPALFERGREIGSGALQRIDLAPLAADAGRRLADELLAKLSPPQPELAAWVAARAEGNPFYIEELVKMLIDHGAISTAGEAWTFDGGKLPAAKLPTTLTGVLQARLDALPRPERLALQQASVIGPVFWDRALAALDQAAPAALPALERRALAVARAEASFDNAREYAFGHQILHQVTYATLLKRSKRALHARAAAWLAAHTGARANDFLGATAEHYALAGDGAQAALFFTRAAEHAKARFAHRAALEHAGRGLALLPMPADAASPRETLTLRWRLLLVRTFALTHLAQRGEQRVALDELAQAADALDDDRLRAVAARRRSLLGMRLADAALQEEEARRAMAFAERAGDTESKLEAQRLLADALAWSGREAEGESLARDGLAQARALGLRRVEGVFLNALSYIATRRDDNAAALALDLQDLPIWRELGDPMGESVALGNVGAGWLWFGRLDEAEAPLRQALKLARDVGSRHTECAPLGNLSQLALWQGDAAQALQWARAALRVAQDVQAPEFEAQTLIRLGEAELALDDPAAADAAFARAEAAGRDGGVPGVECDAIAGRALAALAAGDAAAALRHVETVLALMENAAQPQATDERSALFCCHRVLAQAGDPRAADLLARAHDALQRRAATIGDAALRESFLMNVPLHRSILQAFREALG